MRTQIIDCGINDRRSINERILDGSIRCTGLHNPTKCELVGQDCSVLAALSVAHEQVHTQPTMFQGPSRALARKGQLNEHCR